MGIKGDALRSTKMEQVEEQHEHPSILGFPRRSFPDE